MVDESGRPMTSAFAVRNREDHLPVNWLECFDPRVEVRRASTQVDDLLSEIHRRAAALSAPLADLERPGDQPASGS